MSAENDGCRNVGFWTMINDAGCWERHISPLADSLASAAVVCQPPTGYETASKFGLTRGPAADSGRGGHGMRHLRPSNPEVCAVSKKAQSPEHSTIRKSACPPRDFFDSCLNAYRPDDRDIAMWPLAGEGRVDGEGTCTRVNDKRMPAFSRRIWIMGPERTRGRGETPHTMRHTRLGTKENPSAPSRRLLGVREVRGNRLCNRCTPTNCLARSAWPGPNHSALSSGSGPRRGVNIGWVP